jgi:apolipoprotein N-acyltransferase
MVRSASEEKRSGIVWIIVGLVFLTLMLGMWWLVETTNEEGTHDAELLPLFALIPLGVGMFHLVRSKLHHH